jgi:periplasmic protein CpxP/Spy
MFQHRHLTLKQNGKIMKTFVSIIAIIGFSFAGMAQDTSPSKRKAMDPEARAERMTQRMAEEFSLTDDQKLKVYALHLEQAKQQAQHRETMHAQRREMHQQREATLAQVLTEEQKALREQKMTERKQKWQEHKKGPKGEGYKKGRHNGKRDWKKKE